MTYAEQRERISALRYLTRYMSRDDLALFEMYQKRNTDDEDLDTLSQKRLEEMFDTYSAMKSKPKVKNPFEK
ncbi:MAG: hypothetical protein NTV54_05745 [Ignavibacteriales bacterium]|nr:hypothetical protein [Ignavibacteriales bacterium]